MLKQRAYEHIRAKVLAREVAVGDRLSDVALATELGISRTPVREAIGQLASEGLVELVPRFGAFIRMPDRRDVQELYELRELLETFAVSKAVERMSEKDIAELEAICRTMQELMAAARTDRGTGNSDASSLDRTLHYRWIRNDYSFHMRLIRGAENRWVLKVVSDFHVISTLFSFKKDDPRDRPVQQHGLDLSRAYAHPSRRSLP